VGSGFATASIDPSAANWLGFSFWIAPGPKAKLRVAPETLARMNSPYLSDHVASRVNLVERIATAAPSPPRRCDHVIYQ
jgi:hypothetical protein